MTSHAVQNLSVVVACFNEEANLRRFPKDVIPILQQAVDKFELVLVDDGSTDGSWRVLEQLRSCFPNVIIAKHEYNQGLGAGLRTGFALTSGDAILTLDADLTFQPRELPVMLAAFTSDVDCVMGSPFRGATQGVSALRKFLSWSVNKIYRTLLGLDVSSVSSMFRLYRTSRIKPMRLRCTSFDINAEILFKTLMDGGVIREVPVTLGTRVYGRSKINTMREIKNHFKMFWRIILWKIKS